MLAMASLVPSLDAQARAAHPFPDNPPVARDLAVTHDLPVPEGLPVPTPRPRPSAPAPPPPPAEPAAVPGGAASKAPGEPAPGAARQPADDPGCLERLKAKNVSAEPVALPPQPDPRCTVALPVRLVRIERADGMIVTFPDMPTLACVTAETFSAYVRDLLLPLSIGTYASVPIRIATGPGLECRSRDHVTGAKLSAHGQGLAVDIARIDLADGRSILIGDAKTETDRAFERAARAAGCGYFNTALGPGSDSFHANHWHFDLEPRGTKGDAKFCQ